MPRVSAIALGMTVSMASSSAIMASSRCLVLDMPLSSLYEESPNAMASHGASWFAD